MNEAPSLEEAPFGSRPLGILLSGGAALSSWQGGVLFRWLREEGIAWRSVLGTSGGALNAAGVFQGDLDLLKSIWNDVDRGKFFRFGPSWSPPSIYRQEVLKDFLEGIFSEEKCRREGKGFLYIVCSDIENFETVQSEFSNDPGGRWDGPLLAHLLGSISVPLLLPPVDLDAGSNGNGKPKRRLLVDGHLTSFVDLRPMIERGIRDFAIVTVSACLGADLSSPRRTISSMINGMLSAQMDNGLAAAAHEIRENGVRVFEMKPPKPLPMAVFGFKPEECRAAFAQGKNDAADFLRAPENFRKI